MATGWAVATGLEVGEITTAQATADAEPGRSPRWRFSALHTAPPTQEAAAPPLLVLTCHTCESTVGAISAWRRDNASPRLAVVARLRFGGHVAPRKVDLLKERVARRLASAWEHVQISHLVCDHKGERTLKLAGPLA